MIVTTLIAATVAAAEPAPMQPSAAPAPAAEKKMACCEKMAKGTSETSHAGRHDVSDAGCDCCKDMGKKDAAPAHGEHGDQQH